MISHLLNAVFGPRWHAYTITAAAAGAALAVVAR